MAEVKWVKLNVDMFDDEKIKIIQAMPDGDAILVIWIKLIALAGKTNDGGYIYISENIPYTEEMLSVIMNKPIMTIKLAMKTFASLNMIENDTKGIYLLNFEKHQSLDKLNELKEYNRLAQQRSREKRKALKAVNDMSMTCQQCQGTDIEEEGEKDNISILSGKPDDLPEKYTLIIARLNEKTGANFRSTTESTRRHIHARLEEGFTVEDFYAVIDSKAAEWKNDPRMAPYLRPDTLFCTKFEGYLQAAKRNATGGGVWAREEQDDLDFVK